RQANYVVSFYSTILVEAMLFSVPVVQLNPFGDLVGDYSRNGGCYYSQDGKTLGDLTKRCRADRLFYNELLARQKRFAENYFSNLGCSTESVLETLRNTR
ncbi:MAG: hypothetical protein MN733_28720, partial [Nitrososphaera sp.]|nr:hypothetical protein [Nitrososphaera sp.]